MERINLFSRSFENEEEKRKTIGRFFKKVSRIVNERRLFLIFDYR